MIRNAIYFAKSHMQSLLYSVAEYCRLSAQDSPCPGHEWDKLQSEHEIVLENGLRDMENDLISCAKQRK